MGLIYISWDFPSQKPSALGTPMTIWKPPLITTYLPQPKDSANLEVLLVIWVITWICTSAGTLKICQDENRVETNERKRCTPLVCYNIPMTDPCMYAVYLIWCAIDHQQKPPQHVSINLPWSYGSVVGIVQSPFLGILDPFWGNHTTSLHRTLTFGHKTSNMNPGLKSSVSFRPSSRFHGYSQLFPCPIQVMGVAPSNVFGWGFESSWVLPRCPGSSLKPCRVPCPANAETSKLCWAGDSMKIQTPTRWCPRSLAKLVNISTLTRVYGGYIYS